MSLASLLALAAAVIAAYMVGFWIASLLLRDVSIVDLGWGLGFVVVAWSVWLADQPTSPRAIALLALPTFWGLRLSGYLAWRNWGEEEDRRYAKMRERHGKNFWWISFLYGLRTTGGPSCGWLVCRW